MPIQWLRGHMGPRGKGRAAAEGERPPRPGTTPVSGRRGAVDTTKQGGALAPPWGEQPGPRGRAKPGDHVLRDEALPVTKGESAVGPHQTAGAARKHRQGRTLEGGEDTGYSL